MADKLKNFQEYFDKFDPEIQSYLLKLYSCVKEVIPDAVEKIAWGMPSFWDKKYIVHFDAFKDHVNVYLGPFVTNTYKDKLTDYKFTTRGIQLYYNQEIPYKDIQAMVLLSEEENRKKEK